MPKKYVEKVGDEGFKKAPIGAGPYKFVSFTPGVELVLEAFEGYWRKTPSVKRLVFRSIPDEATRLAALKRGEVDIAYSIRGELAEELKRTPGLTLKPAVVQAPFWLYFPDQWDPKSPWHDQRVRQAASLAIDRQTINQALTLGYSRITGSMIPDSFEFYWQPPAPVYDPARAKQLLAEAGYPNGFDAGFYNCDVSYANLGEAVNKSRQVGIRAKLRPLERAAFSSGYSEKKLQEHRSREQRRLRQCRDAAGGLRRRRAAPTSMAAIPISTRCSSSRRSELDMPSALRSSPGCSRSSMRRSSPRLSGSLRSSTAWDRAWVSRASAEFQASRIRRPMKMFP